MAANYRAKYTKWLEADNLTLLESWARKGLTNEQIAHNIGISSKTLWKWRDQHSEIGNALKKGREVVDFEVENALLLSALGYIKKVKKPIKVKTERNLINKGRIVEEHIEYVEEEIYIPPSNVAQIFWLKNRMPNEWKDKPVSEGNSANLKKAIEILVGVKSAIK